MEIWLTAVMSPDTGDLWREADGDVLESGYLARLAHDLRSHTSPVEWDVLHGPDPGARLVDAATRLPASVIAMTTHGRTGFQRTVLGSVAMDVVHDAPCPVLVARSR